MLKSGGSGRNFRCDICREAPDYKKVWGCTERTTMATPTMVDENIINGEKVIVQFWSCPVKFIPESVWQFLKYKNFYEKHPGSFFPAMDDISPRFLKAEAIYEMELMKCLSAGG